MTYVDLPAVSSRRTDEDIESYVKRLASLLALYRDTIDAAINGNIASDNVRNIAGFNVSKYDLMHISGLAGMSGYDPANPDAIRFWSGDVKDGEPNFKVTQAGILTAIAAMFMTAAGYPRIELNSGEDLLKAMKDATHYIAINPADFGTDVTGVPTLIFKGENGSLNIFENPDDSGNATINAAGGRLTVSAQGDVRLNPGGNLQIGTQNGYTGSFDVITDVDFTSQSTDKVTVTVTKGIITSVS